MPIRKACVFSHLATSNSSVANSRTAADAAVMCISLYFCVRLLWEKDLTSCTVCAHLTTTTVLRQLFFNISTLKTNRVTRTSSCRFFPSFFSFSFLVSLMSAFQENRSSTQESVVAIFSPLPFLCINTKNAFNF